MEGTYPLPEAQIDRFFFKIKVKYPSLDELNEIIEKTTEEYEPAIQRILDSHSIIDMQNLVKLVPISSHVKKYAIRMVMATHPGNEFAVEKTRHYVRYGSSPRGIQSLVLASKVAALLKGRYNVALSDIRDMIKPALRHRIILNLRAETEGIDADEIVDDILKAIPEKA
jgi:MoxR-like ATPase